MRGRVGVSCVPVLAFVMFGSAAYAAPPKRAAGPSREPLERTAGTRQVEESKRKTEMQWIAESLDTVFSIADESHLRGQEGCFPCRQYLPFVLNLKDKSLLEPFLYVAMSSLHLPGSSEWLAAHAAKVSELKKALAKPAA